jgi:hypothetical protein
LCPVVLDASGVILAPAIGHAVGAAHQQPVQHREEHRPFQRKAVLAFARKLRDYPLSGLVPFFQPLPNGREEMLPRNG